MDFIFFLFIIIFVKAEACQGRETASSCGSFSPPVAPGRVQVWFASGDGLGREPLSSPSAGNHHREEEEERLLAGGEGLWLSRWPCCPSQQPLLRAG